MSEYTDASPVDPTELDETVLDVPAAGPPVRWGSRRVIGPFTLRHLLVANTLVVVFLLIMVAVTVPLGMPSPFTKSNSQPNFYLIGARTQGLGIGQSAPELIGTGGNGQQVRLTDLDGHPLSLADLRGHPVWINFWATWCPPCQKETPDLRAAYEAHRSEGLVLIAVDVQEEASSVRDYVTRYGLTYTIGMDVTGAIFHTYRGFGLPTHYFIDRNGIVVDRAFGALDRAAIEAKLAEIIGP